MTSVKSSITSISRVPTTKLLQQHQYTTVASVAHRPQDPVAGPPQPSDPAGSSPASSRPLPLGFSGRGAGHDSSMNSNKEEEHNDDDDIDGQGGMTVVPTTSPVTSADLTVRWECMEADFDSNCLTSFAASSASDSGVTSSESSSSAASAGDARNANPFARDTTSTASTSRTCAMIVAQDDGEDATEGSHVRRSYTHDPYCVYTGIKLISVCTCTTCVPPVAVAAEMAVRTGVSAFSSSTSAAHRSDSDLATTTSHHHASAKQSLSEAALAFDLQQSGNIAASRNITSCTPSPATNKNKSGFTAYPSTAVKRPTQQTWVAEKEQTGGAESNSTRSASSCFSQVQHFHYSFSCSSSSFSCGPQPVANPSLRSSSCHHAERATTSAAAPHPRPPVSICTSSSTSTTAKGSTTTPTTSPLLSRYHHDSPSHGRHFWPGQV